MNQYIYILENTSMPGMVKIGRTNRNASDRANELSSHTGIPTQFSVVKEYQVTDAAAAELQVHERLLAYRVSDNREFFRLSADEAVEILDRIFLSTGDVKTSDFESEDELLAAATKVAVMIGHVRPGLFSGIFKISYEEGERIIRSLKARGVIDGKNDLLGDWRREHQQWLRREEVRRKKEEIKSRRLLEVHYGQIQTVRELLEDLRDPQTGESPEVAFDCEGDELVVKIKGSNWIMTEAQKRLADAFPQGPID